MLSPMGEWGTGSIIDLHDDPEHPERVTGYRVVMSIGGKRVFRRARTKKQAQALRRVLAEERALDLDPERRTVAGFLRSWTTELERARNKRIRATTLRYYTGTVEGHIIPALDPKAKVELRRLTQARIQAWVDGEDAGPRSIQHYHAVLRRALNIAVSRRYIPRNPSIGVELPEAVDETGDPLDADEATRLIETTEADRLGFLWRLAITTGLRQSELLGLGWDDIADGTVTVASQLQRLDGAWVRTPTKAKRSLKRIAIDPDTVAAFERHRRKMAEERTPDWEFYGLVFTTQRGKPLHGRWVKHELDAAFRRAKVRQRRFHDLRHTHQTILVDIGVDEAGRMARAGHSTVAASRRYGRASEAQDRLAADAVGARLRGK